MFRSPSQLPEQSRTTIVDELNARLCDCWDLFSQCRVACWNVKGVQFSAFHPMFNNFSQHLYRFTDCLGDRLVTLGGLTRCTTRYAAKSSIIPEYPQDTVRDIDHVRLLAERFDKLLVGLKATRDTSIKLNDQDTAILCSEIIRECEHDCSFLLAHLDAQR
jgi:starvation-inducible DNA-binding protein